MVQDLQNQGMHQVTPSLLPSPFPPNLTLSMPFHLTLQYTENSIPCVCEMFWGTQSHLLHTPLTTYN